MTSEAARRTIDPYSVAVVHAPVIGVRDNETAEATQRRNAERAASIVEHVLGMVAEPPRLLVFPVLFLTGVNRRRRQATLDAVARQLPGDLIDPIVSVCARFNVYFASTVQETLPDFPGCHFHTAILVGPEGLVLRAPKSQAYSAPGITPLREVYRDYAAAYGEAAILPVVETPIGNIGMLIEKEILVPEAARVLRRKGAEIILHPTQERSSGPEPYDHLRRSTAFTNGVYWLSAGRSLELVETEDGYNELWDNGTSQIIGPDGTVEASLSGRCEGFALARIDLNRVPATREAHAREVTPADVLYQHLYRQ